MSAQKVVMVTGGSGLVGKAIAEVIETEGNDDEKWIFLSSKVSAEHSCHDRRGGTLVKHS